MRLWLRLGAGLVVLSGVAWLAVSAWPEAPASGEQAPRGAEDLSAEGTVPGPMGLVPGAWVLATEAVDGETLSTLPYGDSPSQTLLEGAKGSRDLDVSLELQHAAVLEGVVRTEDGQPLEGAGVSISWQGEELPGDEFPSSDWGETDGEGRYRVGPLHPGRYSLSVSERSSLELEELDQVLGAGETRRDFFLRRAFLAQGVLVDSEGQPVPGESLSLEAVDPEGSSSKEASLTDADGRFSLAVSTPGAFLLRGAGHRTHPLEVPVTVPAEGLRIVAEPLLSVEGEVVDDAGGPISWSTVSIWGQTPEAKSGRIDRAEPDGLGQFTLRVPSIGRYELVAVVAGRDTLRVATQMVDVDGRERPRVRLRLVPGRPLSGVVVDWLGKPVPEVAMQLLPSPRRTVRNNCCHPELHLKTDAEGRFTFAEATGEQVELCLKKAGYVAVGSSSAEPLCTRVRNDGQPLRVILGRELFVTGRLIHADGTAVKHFSVNGQEKRREDGEFSIRVLQPGVEPITLSVPGGYFIQRTAPAFAEGEVIHDLGSIVLGP